MNTCSGSHYGTTVSVFTADVEELEEEKRQWDEEKRVMEGTLIIIAFNVVVFVVLVTLSV